MRVRVLSQLSVVLVAGLLLSSCTLFRQPSGGLKVTSNVAADVYLDNKNVGTTPLSKNPLDVKKYQLKIVPTDPTLVAQESQIKLFPGIETTVEWEFGKTKDDSSGFIYETENAHKRDASELEIITSPDNVPITINGENKGFSPLVIDNLPEGDYQLGLMAPGFASAGKNVRLIKGKRMLITAKLARKPIEVSSPSAALAPMPTPAPVATPKSTPKPTPKLATSSSTGSAVLGTKTAPKPYVEVLNTPTGFLRVRAAPKADAEILGQLNIGDAVSYGGQTTDNWFKIVFGATSSAWVSGQYSKLVQ
jgi:uncharacterized protein YgiM (DUF1202 family)